MPARGQETVTRIGYEHADRLVAYPQADNLSASEQPIRERVCALEFDRFWFVDVYTHNSKEQLAREHLFPRLCMALCAHPSQMASVMRFRLLQLPLLLIR